MRSLGCIRIKIRAVAKKLIMWGTEKMLYAIGVGYEPGGQLKADAFTVPGVFKSLEDVVDAWETAPEGWNVYAVGDSGIVMYEVSRDGWNWLLARLVEQANKNPGMYPVHLSHCFSRIILDTLCGGCWYNYIEKPASLCMTMAQMGLAMEIGWALLQRPEARDAWAWNEASLGYRRQRRKGLD